LPLANITSGMLSLYCSLLGRLFGQAAAPSSRAFSQLCSISLTVFTKASSVCKNTIIESINTIHILSSIAHCSNIIFNRSSHHSDQIHRFKHRSLSDANLTSAIELRTAPLHTSFNRTTSSLPTASKASRTMCQSNNQRPTCTHLGHVWSVSAIRIVDTVQLNI
jgi:hypothetical protein